MHCNESSINCQREMMSDEVNNSRGAKLVGQRLIAQRLSDRLKAIEKFERSSMGHHSSSDDSLQTVEDNEFSCSGFESGAKLNMSGSSRHKAGFGRGRNRQAKKENEEVAPGRSHHRRTWDNQVKEQSCSSFRARSDDKFLPSSSSSDDDEFSSKPFSISRGRGRGKLISSNSNFAAAQNDSSSDSYYSKKSYSRRNHQSLMHNFNTTSRPSPFSINRPSVDSRFEDYSPDDPGLNRNVSSSRFCQDEEFSPSEDEEYCYSLQKNKSFKISEKVDEFDDDFFPSDNEKPELNNKIENKRVVNNFSSSIDEKYSSIPPLKIQKKIEEFDDFFPSDDEKSISASDQEIKSVKIREKINEFDDFFPSDGEEQPCSALNRKDRSVSSTKQADEFSDFFPSDDERPISASDQEIKSVKIREKINEFDDFFPSDSEEQPCSALNRKDKSMNTMKEADEFGDFFPSDDEDLSSSPSQIIKSAKMNKNADGLDNFYSNKNEESLPGAKKNDANLFLSSDENRNDCSSKMSSSIRSKNVSDSAVTIPCRGYVLRPFNRQSDIETMAYFSREEKEEMRRRIQKFKSSSKQDSVIISVNENCSENESSNNITKGNRENIFISKNKDHLPYGLQITHLNYGELFQGKDSILLQSRNSFAGIATAMVAILNSSQLFGRILDGIYDSIIRGNYLTRGRRDIYRRDFDALVKSKIKPRILPGLYTIHFIPIYEGRKIKDEFYVVEIFVDKSGATEPESVVFEVEKEGQFIWTNNVIKKIVS